MLAVVEIRNNRPIELAIWVIIRPQLVLVVVPVPPKRVFRVAWKINCHHPRLPDVVSDFFCFGLSIVETSLIDFKDAWGDSRKTSSYTRRQQRVHQWRERFAIVLVSILGTGLEFPPVQRLFLNSWPWIVYLIRSVFETWPHRRERLPPTDRCHQRHRRSLYWLTLKG